METQVFTYKQRALSVWQAIEKYFYSQLVSLIIKQVTTKPILSVSMKRCLFFFSVLEKNIILKNSDSFYYLLSLRPASN